MPGVAADHHAAVLAKTGQEHLHLHRRGILRFIKDHEGIGQSPPAHKGDGRHLDLSTGKAPFDLFGRHAIIQGVIQGPQIGIDLVLHIAGQEPQFLARLHCRARQDQPLHAAGDQLRHRLRHRDIGLASARRPQRKDDVMAGQRAHIVDLHRAARNDGLAPGADHHRRRAGIAGNNTLQRRLVRHGDQRRHRARVNILPAQQAVVQPAQNLGGAGDTFLAAFDLDAVAARGDEYAQPVFHLHQIGVKLPEQRAQNAGLVKGEFDARTAGGFGDGGEGRQIARLLMRGAGFMRHRVLSKRRP